MSILAGRVFRVGDRIAMGDVIDLTPPRTMILEMGRRWDELTMPVSYRSDRREAERIMLEEVEDVSAAEEAQQGAPAERKGGEPRREGPAS